MVSTRLRKLFEEGFLAVDIAEPLVSFDAEREAADVGRLMEATETQIAGIRTAGLVNGWARRDDLTEGLCLHHMTAFEPGQLLPAEAGLPGVLEALDEHQLCFIQTLGTVDGWISRIQVQKPAARMWLFGVVTMVEMNLGLWIEETYPGDSWQEQLSEGRLEHAREIQQERRRRGQEARLLDCLQFGDKTAVLIREPEVVRQLGFTSQRTAKRFAKELQSLRNNLAHSQDIITYDWPAIARLSRRLERLVRTSELGRAARPPSGSPQRTPPD